MRKTKAILKKQWKETLKNKEVFIQFILFPSIAVIMTNTVKIEGMPKDYFVVLFASMYIGMAPLICMASIIAEEKEKASLRILKMSDVKAWQYLLGVGSYIFLMCLLGIFIFAVVGRYSGAEVIAFIGVMSAGTIISIFIGAMIGTISKSQMNASAIAVPVMMICSFVPMIGSFNKKIEEISGMIYSQQIRIALSDLSGIKVESIVVIVGSMAAGAVLFWGIYRKRGI